ncbi:MAG: peptidoglycan-binding domain-containing protein, partial [Cyanobacteria bacterium J06554_11]
VTFLKSGARGQLVRIAQEALNQKQYYPDQECLVVDEFFGPQTKSSVKLFQRDNGLEPTGELSSEQFEILVSSYKLELSDPKKKRSSEALGTVNSSGSAHTARSWLANALQSPRNKIFGFSIVVIVLSLSAVGLTQHGYGATITISEVIGVWPRLVQNPAIC